MTFPTFKDFRKVFPGWIKDRKLASDPGLMQFYVKLEPLQCRRKKCGIKWYPRIKRDGTVEIPSTCPECKSNVWWKEDE